MAKNRIFSTGSKEPYKSKYYSRSSTYSTERRREAAKKGWQTRRKNIWSSSDARKGKVAHNRLKAFVDSLSEEEKEKFHDYYHDIRKEAKENGSGYDDDELFSIGDRVYAGEDIHDVIDDLTGEAPPFRLS